MDLKRYVCKSIRNVVSSSSVPSIRTEKGYSSLVLGSRAVDGDALCSWIVGMNVVGTDVAGTAKVGDKVEVNDGDVDWKVGAPVGKREGMSVPGSGS